MKNMIHKYIFMIFVIALIMVTNISKTHAACNYHKKQPCKDILNNELKDRTGHATSHCQQLKANDGACDKIIPSAAAYTAMAVVCAVACYYEVWSVGLTWVANATKVCTLGSLAISAYDFAEALKVKNSGYSKKAHAMMATDWGVSASSASVIGSGLAVCGGLSGGVSNCLTNFREAMPDRWIEPGSNLGKGSGTAGAGGPGAQGGGGGANAGSNSASKPGEKAFVDKDGSACLSAGLNIAMATFKWIDYSKIEKNSQKNSNQVNSFISDLGEEYSMGGNNGPGGLGAGGAQAPPNSSDDRDSNGDDSKSAENIRNKVDGLNNSGSLAATFADGELKKAFGGKSKAEFQKAFDTVQKQTGLSMGRLAEIAEKDGISAALTKALGDSKNAEKLTEYAKKVESNTKQYLESAPNLLSANTSAFDSSAVTARQPANINLGKFIKKGALAGNVGPQVRDKTVEGFEGDIWHIGTTKSIFEIVSEKTQSVSNRIEGR